MSTLSFDIESQRSRDGGLYLELSNRRGVIAAAQASPAALRLLQSHLSLSRDHVEQDLRRALEHFMEGDLDKVTLTKPVEDPERPLRFYAKYIYRDHRSLETGLVWYDVRTSQTGPNDEELSALVRNTMRHEVHRLLTSENSTARALVDLHRG